MKILVIGGTRFFGRAFTELALSKGHDVTIFHRGESDSEHFSEARRVLGDRHDDLEKLGDGSWDAVLDTCAYVPHSVEQASDYLKDKVNQYVFISTISVYAPSSELNRDEDADLIPHPEDEPIDELKMENYGSLKVLCEEALDKAMPNKVTHIRPGLIVGPHDATNRFTYWQTRVNCGGDVLVPGDGSSFSQIIDARDLAQFALTLIENQTYGVFNATGPQTPHTLQHILDTAKEITGSDANFVHVDAEWLVENEVAPWMELPLWIPSAEGQAMMNMDVQRGIDAGLTFRPLVDTIRDTLAWYADIKGDEQEWQAGMKPERETEILKKWAEKPE
ncbi:MAG: SDR family oxidoreductase [Phototrophicaceae bacterium]